MRWLSMLLSLHWTCCILDARGLVIDLKQQGDGRVHDGEVSPDDDKEPFSDDQNDGGHHGKKDNMNFIYQFLLGNLSSLFEDVGKVINEDSKIEEIKTNLQEEPSKESDEVEKRHKSHSSLIKPSEDGIHGRQNKVFWTDEELETVGVKQDDREEVILSFPEFASMEVGEFSRAGRLESSVKEMHQVATGNELSKVSIEGNNATTDSPAQDRQQVVDFSDLSVNTIEDTFQQIVLNLPNMIDQTREVIVEDIATTNMLGYTLALSYFVGAALDTIGDFLVNERFLTELISDTGLWYLLGWLWWYAAGFAGPWLFPSTFSGGDPNLSCSSVDFFAMLADSDLSLNINSITSRSPGEMSILSEKLRVDFNSRLGCIVNKRGEYKEAAQIHSMFEKMLSLINLHQLLTISGPGGRDDILALDQELRQIWARIPLLVEETHAAVTIRRANTAGIYTFVGVLNLLGAISGVLLNIPTNSSRIPELGAFPGAIVENAQDLATNGRFSNDLLLGEIAFIGAAAFGWGYGYTMTYFLFLEEADPGCGRIDLDNVYSRYQQLSSLEVLLSTGQVRTTVVRYFVSEWRSELGIALHCLLSTEEGNMLGDIMDMFVSLANARLDMS